VDPAVSAVDLAADGVDTCVGGLKMAR
jgi:hypothetical protein